MKRTAFVITAGIVCLLAASAINAAQTAPRLIFKAGDVLTYRVSFYMKGTDRSSGESGSELTGTAILKALSVQKDGTARIKLTSSGKGTMTIGTESIALDSDKPMHVILLVKPNGAIAGLRDAKGRKTTFTANIDKLFDAGFQVQVIAAMTYTLFGLQLPDKLPSRGGNWTGYHKNESVSGVGTKYLLDIKPSQVKLERVPIKYTYLGKRKFKGSACLAFSYDHELTSPRLKVPFTFYFDQTKGRILGMRQDVKKPDFTQKIALDLVK